MLNMMRVTIRLALEEAPKAFNPRPGSFPSLPLPWWVLCMPAWVHSQSLSHWIFANPWTVAHQAPVYRAGRGWECQKEKKTKTKNLRHNPHIGASLMAQMINNLHTMQETQVKSLGQEDPLEKRMATHSSILAWRTSWTEEPGRL